MKQVLVMVALAAAFAAPAQAQTARFYGDRGYLSNTGYTRYPAYRLTADRYVKVPLNRTGSIKEYRVRPTNYQCVHNYGRRYSPNLSRLAFRAEEIDSELGFQGFENVSLRSQRFVADNRDTMVCRSGYRLTTPVNGRRARGYFYGRQ
ncbi:MAG: hypothetical protein GC134_06615 [Proteobacteria bacterium]|nr:hypothetical protein [Pseudomonadota bacterium]